MPDDPRYSLTELADLAGVTPRTVRYYITSGLLPSAGRSGPGAKYGDEDLARLRLIRRLQREHLPLAEIRQRWPASTTRTSRSPRGRGGTRPEGLRARVPAPVLEPASPPAPQLHRDQAVRPVRARAADGGDAGGRVATGPMPALAASGPPVDADRGGPSAGDAGDRSQWERIALAPDIELHVRRPLSRTQNKRVDRLLTIARELLEEDPS